MKSHEWTFAKVGTTVHDNIFEVLIAGSLSYLYSWLPTALFYLHRGTSHIRSCWHVFSGRAPERAALGLSFRERKRRNGQFFPFSLEDNNVFINPWIQTALFLIIAIAATSAAVIWQFAGWISQIPLRLIISILTDYQQSTVSTMQTNILERINSCQFWIITVWGCIYPTKLRFPNIAHDPRCLKTSQNTSIADPAAITRWPL